MTTIHAPAKVLGRVTDSIGGLTVEYVDGVAEVDNLPDAIRAYMLGAGYTVDGVKVAPADTTERPDSRLLTEVLVGGELRDAAVDPRPSDFLAPVNAGEHDPMGPLVASPGIHALDGVVLAGPVGDLVASEDGPVVVDDKARGAQEARELAEAEAVLVGDAPRNADAVTGEKADLGPLGLSDPGSVPAGGDTSGPAVAAEVVDINGDPIEPGPDGIVTLTDGPPAPKHADPVATWRAHADAVEPGVDHSEVTKADLIAKFG